MDALVLAPPERKPTGLEYAPEGALDRLAAAALFYPYCSHDVMGVEVLKAADEDWSRPTPLLVFLPQADKVSDVQLCEDVFARHAAKGLPVEVVELHGVGHTFDQTHDDHGERQKEYDREAAQAAYRMALEFFERRLK
jgi:dienelactone hydrolase